MAKVRRHNAVGRSIAGPRWIQLWHWLIESDAFRDLSPNAVYVLIFLWKRYNGRNNGSIGFGVRSGCIIERGKERDNRRLILSRSRIADALAELERQGFIACMQEGEYGTGAHLAREWRLTWLKCDRTGELPTKEFMRPAGDRDTVHAVIRKSRKARAARLLERRKLNAESRHQDCRPHNSLTNETVPMPIPAKNAPGRLTGRTVNGRNGPTDETHIITIVGDEGSRTITSHSIRKNLSGTRND